MTAHQNCEGLIRRDCLKLGLGALMGGGLANALRGRAEASSSTPRQTSCILIWLDGGAEPFRDIRPEAAGSLRNSRRVRADRDARPRHVLLGEHDAARGHQRQADDRPLGAT